jgi:cytoskeletal protein CcmA (bactofilin family)
MFSKSRINDPAPRPPEPPRAPEAPMTQRPSMETGITGSPLSAPPMAPKGKLAASVLSPDLQITGNLRTTGDIVIEGVVDGDIRAHLLTVGESATIRGEIVADDIVINGRVIGRVRGLKVRLTSTARVEGDIIHKTIAIESGAHFEGSVQRQEDPLASSLAGSATMRQPAPASPAQQPAPRPSAPPPAAEAPRPAPKPPVDVKPGS